jgi:hypothetical protein
MNQTHVPPWKTLLERKSAQHYRRFHSETPTFTRRGFLSTAAGAAGLLAASQFSLAPFAHADKTTAQPNPIPGGAVPLGIRVHHNPLPAVSTTPLDQISDPSEIGDFNGLIADTMIRGGGTGTGFNQTLAYRADMGAMQGEYVGEDGNHHHGSFVFI